MSRPDIDAMTYEDKLHLFADLCGSVVGPVKDDGKVYLPVIVPAFEPRDDPRGIRIDNHLTFRPRRLVILEPVVERRVKEETVASEEESRYDEPAYHPLVAGRRWARAVVDVLGNLPRRVVTKTRTTTRTITLRSERVLRGAWRIHGMFAAANNCFPNAPAKEGLCGDEFGPDGETAHFRALTMNAGLPFSIILRHVCDEPVPFMAVIVGDPVEHKQTWPLPSAPDAIPGNLT